MVVRAHGVGGDLVFYHRRAHDGAHQPPSAASGAGADNLILLAVKLFLQQAHQLFHRADGIALCPDVSTGKDSIIAVDDDALC